MPGSKKHVFITEPSWFEKTIPDWVNANKHIIISDSQCVLLKAYRKKIDCIAMGSYLSSKDIYIIDKEELEKEMKLIFSVQKKLPNFQHISSLLRSISMLTASSRKISISLQKIIELHEVDEIILVKGSRFNAMPFETPRGGFLIHYLLARLCKKQDIKYSVSNHQLESYFNCKKSDRYDKAFNLNKDTLPNNLKFDEKDLPASKVLFLYCYEMCLEDLAPLLRKYDSVFKGAIGKNAPSNQNYHFNFLNMANKNSSSSTILNEDILQIFEKAIRSILHSHSFDPKHLEKLISRITSSFLEQYKSIQIIINNIHNTVLRYNINSICLTAFPSPLQIAIAEFFSDAGLDVKMRQHGALTDPFFHERCFVKGSTYLANSHHIIPSFYSGKSDKLDFIPRDRTLSYEVPNIRKDGFKEKKILITDDLFFSNAEHKVDNIIFLENFMESVPQKFQLAVRSHPRYKAQSFTDSNFTNFIYEDSRKISAAESLSDSFICLIPHCSPTSFACDAITANVPVIFFVPQNIYKQFSFSINFWKFPTIVSSPKDLITLIKDIEDDSNTRSKIIAKQQKWLDHQLGKSKPKFVKNKISKIRQEDVTLSPIRYFQICVRTLLVNLYNTYKL